MSGRRSARLPGFRVPPLLREVTFRRYWTGSVVSRFGDQISGLAVPLTAVLILHAGPAAMGY
ncbi:hypothetical protein B2A_08306, partial [mine drainage metagenome]